MGRRAIGSRSGALPAAGDFPISPRAMETSGPRNPRLGRCACAGLSVHRLPYGCSSRSSSRSGCLLAFPRVRDARLRRSVTSSPADKRTLRCPPEATQAGARGGKDALHGGGPGRFADKEPPRSSIPLRVRCRRDERAAVLCLVPPARRRGRKTDARSHRSHRLDARRACRDEPPVDPSRVRKSQRTRGRRVPRWESRRCSLGRSRAVQRAPARVRAGWLALSRRHPRAASAPARRREACSLRPRTRKRGLRSFSWDHTPPLVIGLESGGPPART